MGDATPTFTAKGLIPRGMGWLLLFCFALGAILVGNIYSGTLTIAGVHLHRVRAWQILYGLGFLGYVLLLWSFRSRPARTWTLICGAIFLRVMLLFCPPNNDCHRYIWEGRMQRLGFNPFLYAPNDETLRPYRDAIWQGINKKHYSTIYPPLSQLEFRGLSAISYSVKTPQVAHGILDIGVVLALLAWLLAIGQPAWFVAIYALCPLTLASFAHAGHNDPLMILAVLGFLAAARKKHWVWAGVALGLAILAKTVPAILLALLVRRSKVAMAVAIATVLLGYLLYIDAGSKLYFALFDFPEQSHFNNLFDELRIWINQTMGVKFLARDRFYLVLAVLVSAAAYKAWRVGDLLSDARWLLIVLLLALPIIHFWYVTWALALITLKPRGFVSWILLTGLMVLYWQADFVWQIGGRWKLPTRMVCFIWVPFFLAWTAETLWQRRLRLLRSGGKPVPQAKNE